MASRHIYLVLFLLISLHVYGSDAASSSANAVESDTTPDQTPAPVTCAAGAPIGQVELKVKAPNQADPLPFQTINHLGEGDTLLYAPILRGHEKRSGQVAVVMVPVKTTGKSEDLIVSDPKAAEKPQQWSISQPISLAVFVYGPDGLSKKKVQGFLSQDNLLIAQLADYAEKTAETEALIEALENSGSSSASINAALSGFASQYGFAVSLDKTAAPQVQAQELFSSMNPQLAAYNPIAGSTATAVGQTASLATAAATLFFGSPIGLAAGGTAMLLELRSIAFPGTQFRSSFAQPVPGSGLNLCGQRAPTPPHTRIAYIWATRIPNVPAPDVQIGKANYVLAGQKTSVPVEVPEPNWKYLQRARDWALEGADKKKTPITVLKLGNQKAIELGLDKANVAPGDYTLSGEWDWKKFDAKGEIHVRAPSNFADAKLDPASQNRLLARSGKIPVTVLDNDFEFIDKVELKKSGDEFATPEPVRFLLPEGAREGPQSHMDVQIDTSSLDPGTYALILSQQDGKAHDVDLSVLANPPKIDNLPVVVNQGAAMQHYVLKGERLDLLQKLEADGIRFDLGTPGAKAMQRNITVQLKPALKPGTVLPIRAYLSDRSEPLLLSDALQITGPLPLIASSKLSLPTGTAITILPEEFPAGSTLTAMLDVKNIEPSSTLLLSCGEDATAQTSLRVGQQTTSASLQQLSPDQLFLSFDTSSLPAGCAVRAVLDNGRDGKSEPFTLAHIIRLPQIESAALTGESLNVTTTTGGPAVTTTQAPQMHAYSLTGLNLEMIAKAGWNSTDGIDVTDLPTPIPGQGQKQSLTIHLPDPPSGQPTLFVWLRGDKEGRATTTTMPVISKPVRRPPSNPVNTPTPAPTGVQGPDPNRQP